MRAMIIEKFGGPEVFKLKEMPKPEPGFGEILVKVIASGTNPVDAKNRAGGYSPNLKLPAILGFDAAGIVEKTGAGVTKFKPGDEVYYTPLSRDNSAGTYAEYNVVKVDYVAFKPKNLSFIEAAAIPLAGGTAWEAIVRRINIMLGETILIHGAAGGVGTFAVQFAHAAGAKIIATAGKKNHNLLKDLGADIVIDYHEKDAAKFVLDETNGVGVDAVFDIQGENIVSRSLPGIRLFGRIACILPPKGELGLLNAKNITLHGILLTRESQRLEQMTPVFEKGLAHPVIDEVLPLEEVSKAHERLDSGHGKGKIVLSIANGHKGT